MFKFFGRKGEDGEAEEVTEEELLEIHELKAEQVLADDEEEDLKHLRDKVDETQRFLHAFMQSAHIFSININTALDSSDDDQDHNLAIVLPKHQENLREANQRLQPAITRLKAIATRTRVYAHLFSE